MKFSQIKLIIALLIVSVFLTACMERAMKYDTPSGEINDSKNAKKNLEVAEQDYKAAKEDYELAKKNYNKAEKNTSVKQEKKTKNKVIQTTYKESSLLISIYASPQVNLDPYGRPDPVSVHVFQLDEADIFDTLDYNTLVTTTDPAAIDRTFISKQVLDFFPDEKQKIFLKLDKEAHYIGVLATYSNLTATRWRAIVPLSSMRNILTITLGEDGIQIAQ